MTNSGTASGSGYVSSLAAGIDASATGDGAISITNTGTVSGSNMGGGSGIGIDAITAGSGNITITNSGPVTGTAIGTASGIYASASGTGNIIITNNAGGTIVANSTGGPGYGLGAIAAAGTAQVTNAATIGSSSSAADFGLDVAGTTVSITNTGAIGVGSGGGSAFAISGASSSGTLSIANSAALTANSLSGSAYDIIALGAGDTTIQNTGSATLTATATVYYGNAYGILASQLRGNDHRHQSAGHVHQWLPWGRWHQCGRDSGPHHHQLRRPDRAKCGVRQQRHHRILSEWLGQHRERIDRHDLQHFDLRHGLRPSMPRPPVDRSK